MMSTAYHKPQPPFWHDLIAQYSAKPFATLHHLAFMLSIILYAIAGSPTPDALGGVEIGIAILLFSAIGIPAFYNVVRIHPSPTKAWLGPARIFLFYSLSAPLLYALWAGNSVSLILRDTVALLFLCLPLFLHTRIESEKALKALIWLYILLAIALCIRSLSAITTSPLSLLFPHESALHYLSNSPSIVFTAIILIGHTINTLSRPWSLYNWLKAGALLTLLSLPLIVMTLTLQRASLGACIIAAIALIGLQYTKSHAIIIPTLILGTLAITVFEPLLDNILWLMREKTLHVGTNNRIAELQTVWQQISQNPVSLLLGQGWGATFASPAVGGMTVNFTHSLLSSLLLKTGLIGVCLGCVYLLTLFRIAITHITHSPRHTALGYATFFPFIISTFLYANYKSYDFGLLLCIMIALPCIYNHNRKKDLAIAKPAPVL